MKKRNIDKIINKKCAPNKKYISGSCLSEKSINKIVQAYNKRNDDKIDTNLPKEILVKTLETKLSDQCSNHVCWTRLDFIKELYDNEITDSFRPEGPVKKYDWLSTTHINEVLEQYQYLHKDFLFLGAVPYDFEDLPILGLNNINYEELEKNNKFRIGLIINLDEHYKRGSHWVSLYFDLKKNQIYFFDSVGIEPPKRIKKFINKIVKYLYQKIYNIKLPLNNVFQKLQVIKNMNSSKIQDSLHKYIHINNIIQRIDLQYNSKQHQIKNSECGVSAINFIIRLLENEQFHNITNNIIRDDAMNSNRKIYFYNVI
jgi:hypothetical protein